MKQAILILSVILSAIISSCSDEIAVDNSGTKNKCSVTFHLSKSNDSGLDMITRSGNIIPIPENYSVMFYLFQAEGNEYKLMRGPESITSPVLTLDGLTEDQEYRYVFVAINNPTKNEAIANVLKALDFGTTVMAPGVWSIQLPVEASTANNSLLKNCFLDIFDYTTYGDAGDPDKIEEITIDPNKDMDIFGAGSYFLPGSMTAAIGVTLERQVGVVEFKYEDAIAGDQLECSFSSDYYRLYLSQMVKDKNNPDYTSENAAAFSYASDTVDPPFNTYKQGDYYSVSRLFYTNYLGLPTFKKSVTLSGTENSIKVYMPYTTSAIVGTTVDDIYKAHYIRTTLSADATNTPGDITLHITAMDGTKKSFRKAGVPFPIYRNGKTIFTTVGSDYLSVNFGNSASDNGIYLPNEDKWDGDN